MFGGIREWFERRRALRELGASEGEYSHANRRLFEVEIERAVEAADCGDRDQALQIWHRLRGPYKKRSMRSKEVVQLLLTLGAFDELDAMMQSGLRHHSNKAHFVRGFVLTAHRRGDLQETLLRCEMARRKFPGVAEGYTIATTCLSDLGRQEEAEAMIGLAVRKLPGDFEVCAAHARYAERRQDWQEALARWQLFKRRFDHFLGPVGMAQCLRQMGRYAEAEASAAEACERFPKDSWGFVELAAIASAKGDLDGAVRRWEDVRRQFPFFYLGYTSGGEALRRAGREAEVDDVLAKAVARVRSDLSVHLEYARTAQIRGDWSAAAERWALVCERFPDCEEARQQEAQALAALGQRSETAAATDPPSAV